MPTLDMCCGRDEAALNAAEDEIDQAGAKAEQELMQDGAEAPGKKYR